MLAFIIGLTIGIILGNVGLLAFLAWVDANSDTRNGSASLQRTADDVDALAVQARGTLARCSDMHPDAYDRRRDRRAGDRPQHSGKGGAA